MNTDQFEQENELYHEQIVRFQESLDNEEVGSEEYSRKLKDLKTLQTLKTMSANAEINGERTESKGEKWFDRALKVAGVIAPFAVTAIMIWWDRREEGGSIMSKYVNPALRSGDGAPK